MHLLALELAQEPAMALARDVARPVKVLARTHAAVVAQPARVPVAEAAATLAPTLIAN